MKKTRAPGGGRKPLTPTEPTVKVAVTLLASQVEATTQLGNGNLSAGIRKAINMYSRRQHLINAIANQIDLILDQPELIEAKNKAGFTVDVRWQDGEYVSDSDWTRVNDIHLSPDELQQAIQIASR